MTHIGAAKSGKSLLGIEGHAGLRPSDLAYRLRRAALTGLSVAALVVGSAAALAAYEGVAKSGVSTGDGGVVAAVTPTGFGWGDGIRPGQTVVSFPDASQGDWRMVTVDADGVRRTSDGAGANSHLRDVFPLGLAAAGAALLALLFVRTHRSWAAPTAVLAILAASGPLELHGEPISSTIAMGGAAAIPLAAFGGFLHGRGRWTFLALVGAATVGWAWLRLTGSAWAADLEPSREAIAYTAAAALVLERGWAGAMSGHAIGVIRPRLSDVLGIVAIVLIAGAVTAYLNLELLPAAVVVVLLLAVIPVGRQRLGRPIEDALFADLRESAAAEATERERARLAREIHDVPLQELVAVIRRLEIQPGAEAETEDLRALAGHLRNVATELRPPVLDDLGLPAALDYLAEQAATPAVPVTATVDDQTGFGEDRRPPTDVELAMYRIAAEAVGNAIRHSGGSVVRIDAAVAPDRVTLEVTDDGAGLAPEKAREATKRKRLGLTSMRRRAEAIDAELSIDGSRGGTRVRVTWQA
jgi:signal transduction histidine kinase